jgi:hypothetical protein
MAAVILWLTCLDKARDLSDVSRMQPNLQAFAAETEPFSAEPLAAARIGRGVMRLLDGLGFAALQEFPLRARRRADVIALHASGEIVIVEIKSGRADFQSDRKWPEYLEFCDRFFFAVEPDFPQAILPLRPDRRRCPWRRHPAAGAARQAQRQPPAGAHPGDRDVRQPKAGPRAGSDALIRAVAGLRNSNGPNPIPLYDP